MTPNQNKGVSWKVSVLIHQTGHAAVSGGAGFGRHFFGQSRHHTSEDP
jgi:hypothetical protein